MRRLASTKPLYRCAACDQLAVRRFGGRCKTCKAQGIPAKPIVTTSHFKHMQRIAAENSAPRASENLYYVANSPYERAVRETEERTGLSRDQWEPIIGHHLVRETDARARQLAGILEERTPSSGMKKRKYA